jgi:hypothetical protein
MYDDQIKTIAKASAGFDKFLLLFSVPSQTKPSQNKPTPNA